MSPRIWLRKLDWIAQHGGMALVDVHPDYVIMPADNSRKPGLPLESYTAFLSHVQRRCNDQPWTALPKEVVQHARKHLPHPPMTLTSRKAVVQIGSTSQAHKIWIDLDNTPHVPFFEPIIEELNRLGHRVLLTARDAFQVCELADQKGLRYTRVGRHHGKHKLVKGLGLFWRASQLASTILREKPDLGLSHGSRSQVILCNVLRIPSVMLADYEYARLLPLMCPTWEMAPEVVPNDSLYCPPDRVRKYPGIKEDVYVSRLRPDPGLLGQLGLNGKDLIVTVRPPATEAHYHNPDSERLFVHFMNRACRCEGLRVVLLPRNLRQGHELCAHFPHWFAGARTVIPNGAVDGLNLLWYSDLVVSGGGTMNREAAALGVPVYSIFRGRIGAVDHYLQSQGRLVLIETTDDIERKIEIRRRDRSPMNVSPKPTVQALPAIIEHLEEILRVQYPEETAKRS